MESCAGIISTRRRESAVKVLLVEDGRNYAFLLEAMLRSSEIDPLSMSWADNLQTALELYQRESADVILADLSLPDSSGLATVTALKAKVGATPIIVLTACSDERLASEALRHGAQDYLIKTEIDKRALQRALRYAIERQRSEDKYRELVESVDAIVWEADPVTWRFNFISRAAEKILGYPIERWLQSPEFWINLIHPDDRSAAVEYCKRQTERGNDHEFEYRALALDGRVVWLRDLVRVIRNEFGRPISLRGVMVDISQSKVAAAELLRHHQEINCLQEIGQIILEAAEPMVGIQNALEKVVALQGFDLADILLTTPEGHFLSLGAACGYNDPANLQKNRRGRSAIHAKERLLHSSIIHNVQSGDRGRTLKAEGVETLVNIPLRSGDKSLGVLHFASRKSKEIRPHDMALFEAIGQQFANAIQKAQLRSEIEKRSQELGALLDVSSAANRSLNLQQILQEVAQKVAQIFTFDATQILLLNERRDEVRLTVSYQIDDAFSFGPKVFKLGQGISGHAAADGQPVVVENIDTDPRYEQLTHYRSAKKIGQKFAASFPIKYEGETVGVITCVGRPPRRLTDHEMRLIASMSSQVAVAVVNARYFAETLEQASQLRSLASHLETIREQERTRISRELHDELGQALTSLKFDVAWINARLDGMAEPLSNRLAAMLQALDSTLRQVRKISAQLRPDILDKLGLSAAMEWQLQEFRQRTGINYHFSSYPADIRLDENASVALFRIMQEALTNVARHSQASRVTIVLEQQPGDIHLRIDDDGIGIDEARIYNGQSLGLLGMRERAASLGGDVTFQRNNARGTCVTSHLPVEPQRETRDLL
jgi:PAS domain S-box-containing protein